LDGAVNSVGLSGWDLGYCCTQRFRIAIDKRLMFLSGENDVKGLGAALLQSRTRKE